MTDRAADDDGFPGALRSAVAELTARYNRIPLPEGETDPVTRVLAAIGAGLLDTLPGEVAGKVLRMLGEEAARDGG